MKTIEQKAEAYERALEKAKEALKDGTISQNAIAYLQDIFPELKESEDERVRKWIKKELESKYVVDNIVNNVMADKALAWIEKQCEQKSKFRVGDTIKSKYDDRQFTIKSVDLDRGTYTYTQEGCGNDIDYADEEFELVEQKSVAWSEEDAQYLLICKNALAKYQVSDKWDSRVISCWLENKLKALQKQWKPSDEQMNALEQFVRSIGESDYSSPYDNNTKLLYSLLEQLKKLKGE